MSGYRYFVILLLLFSSGIKVNASLLFPYASRAFADSCLLRLPRLESDTNKVILLLKLANFCVYKPGEEKADMDSAGTYLTSALDLSNALHYEKGQIMSLMIWGVVFSESGDNARGIRISKKAIALSMDSKETLLMAKAWFYLGERYTRSKEGLIDKNRCYRQAMIFFERAGDKESRIDMLGRIADIHYIQGNYVQSLREFVDVLAQFRSINGPLHFTYNMLTEVNNCLGNYQESIKYGRAAIESAKAAKDTSALGFFYTKLATAYYDLNQWAPGIQYLEKALLHFERQNETMMVLSTGNGICRGMVNMGEAKEALTFYNKLVKRHPPNNIFADLTVAKTYGRCYMGLKQYRLAEKTYLTMISLLRRVKKEDVDFVDLYRDIGNYYLTMKEYDKAQYYLVRR